MARRSQPLGPVEHTLLGLLAIRPRHGYELAEVFAPSGELAGIYHLHLSLLYAHLKRLESLGLIEGTLVPQGARPAKVIHTITPAGAATLRAWLDTPVRHNRDIRLEFLLKLYLSRQLPDYDTGRLVDRQLVLARDWVGSLRAEIEGHPPGSFERLVREMRLHATGATVAWLESCREASAAPAGV